MWCCRLVRGEGVGGRRMEEGKVGVYLLVSCEGCLRVRRGRGGGV